VAAAQVTMSPVSADDFIATLAGSSPSQFVEGRLPALAELGAAVPDHPVFAVGAFFSGRALRPGLLEVHDVDLAEVVASSPTKQPDLIGASSPS
jgi:hypothetical protein